MSEYSEKLKDPRWQKKRLEILKRDVWTCRSCMSKEKTLQVHHIFYLPNIDPWDIPDGFLITFCESCHKPDQGDYDAPGGIIRVISAFLGLIWEKAENKDFIDCIRPIYLGIKTNGLPPS